MAIAAIALCKWNIMNWETKKYEPEDNDPPTACRASVGEKIVTVWLPQGAKIRCRVARANNKNPFDQKYCHYYGYTARMRIDITLVQYLGEK